MSVLYVGQESLMSVEPKDKASSTHILPQEAEQTETPAPPPEQGGRGGLEPTRYGDWEVGGICSDF
jgi:hypothetical protein